MTHAKPLVPALGFSLLALIGGTVLVGCGGAPKSAQAEEAAPAQAAATPPTAAPGPPKDSPAQALARKTEDYAAEIEAILQQRGAAAPPPDEVQWADTSDLSLAPVPRTKPMAKVKSPPPVPAAPSDPPAASVPMSLESPPENPARATLNSAADRTTRATNPGTALNKDSSTPALVAPPVRSFDSPETLVGRLHRRVQENPRDLSAQLDHQLARFIQDEQTPHMASLSMLPTEDRDLISTVIDGLVNFRAALRHDANLLPSGRVRPLVEMADRLRSQVELSLPKAILCSRVDGFARYEPITGRGFPAGRESRAILYVEIDNFSARLTEQQTWETSLTLETVLYTEQGQPVWNSSAAPVSDVARSPRRDFFLVKPIRLPDSLTIGRYLLKVTVVDQQASRVAEASVPVNIIAE